MAVVWATNRFQSYLFGNSFKLVTDHESLKWIMTTQKLTKKLARSSLLLQENDFTVEHRARKDNTNADCLSRDPLSSNTATLVLGWTKGEIVALATFLAFMVGNADQTPTREEEMDIRDDEKVLRFLQTHKYGDGTSAKERDRIY